jgi:hypothetical protein
MPLITTSAQLPANARHFRPEISLDHCSLSLALPSKVQDPNCGPPRQQSDRTLPTMIRAI